MSKVKTPQEKKAKSLKLDRRNAYHENPAASRKGIARGKQRAHMNERRTATQVLNELRGQVADEDHASEAELSVKVKVAIARGKGFKKQSDIPLELMVERKKIRRARREKKKTSD